MPIQAYAGKEFGKCLILPHHNINNYTFGNDAQVHDIPPIKTAPVRS
ncbi:hypothetical protein A0J48_009935 [Sphaerospermopsis aphanizomenoides BCCUSP55]|nr:hypothetical protein [Sphaerospermopsis aphanizomenoides]MBK1987855.1 hypothetical protein [Sphaerospermopsis aphanizomenoides BCCUSP55]